MEKVFHTNGNIKKARVAILTWDKIDFKTKTVTRNKEGYYILINYVLNPGRYNNCKIYAPDIGVPKYIKQILTAIKR